MTPKGPVTAPAIVTAPTVLEAPSALLEGIAEASSAREARLELPSGRSVEAAVEAEGERLTVRGASGDVELTVLLTERGPVLRFRAADLELASAGNVRLDCERFHVRATKGIRQETRGDLELRAGGDATVRARGELAAVAAGVRIEAQKGDLALEANDDVTLVGERVKLNC